jgi:hypothetical protein
VHVLVDPGQFLLELIRGVRDRAQDAEAGTPKPPAFVTAATTSRQ